MFSISCSFSENLAKLYAGAPRGRAAPPPTGNPGSAPVSAWKWRKHGTVRECLYPPPSTYTSASPLQTQQSNPTSLSSATGFTETFDSIKNKFPLKFVHQTFFDSLFHQITITSFHRLTESYSMIFNFLTTNRSEIKHYLALRVYPHRASSVSGSVKHQGHIILVYGDAWELAPSAPLPPHTHTLPKHHNVLRCGLTITKILRKQ